MATDPFSTDSGGLTVLQASAAQIHELFISYVDAGFARSEALELVKTVLAAGGQAT